MRLPVRPAIHRVKELPLRLDRAHRRVAPPRRIPPPRDFIAAEARPPFRGREPRESVTRGNPPGPRANPALGRGTPRRGFGRHDDPELARLRRLMLPGLGGASLHDT